MSFWSSLNFDIDRHLNHFVPPPPWRHLPYSVSWFFGYRKTKPRDVGNLVPIFWAFIGAFAAICAIQAASMHIPSFQAHHSPTIIGSYGAAAVLEFYSIEAPLAQPRNAIFGQVISGFVGTAVCKLFLLSSNFNSIRWIGGALACAAATSLMALTKTVHPPAGATALLAVVDDQVVELGWFLLPVLLLSCGLMLSVALLINNIQRRFPVYWWTPEELSSYKKRPIFRRRRGSSSSGTEVEKDQTATTMTTTRTRTIGTLERTQTTSGGLDPVETKDVEAEAETSSRTENKDEVVIRPGEVVVPEHMYLTPEEQQFLETLAERL